MQQVIWTVIRSGKAKDVFATFKQFGVTGCTSAMNRTAGIRCRASVLACLFLVVAFVPGCLMHSFGQGSRADMHGPASPQAQGKAIIKEVQAEQLVVTLEVPPLHSGEAAKLWVRVADRESSTFRSDARVAMSIFPLAPGMGSRAGTGTMTHVVTWNAADSAYVVVHRFEAIGSHEIMAEVHSAEVPDRPPVVVAVRQEVTSAVDRASRRFLVPLFVLSAAAMLGIMAFMFR